MPRDDELRGERGVMLHFLANHELLAAELMALVLLRFPNAPKEYRAGVYEAMREEQAHALMYVRRMKECGIAFGELPVNDHFWKLVAPMETPLDFVTRLNLTFEQANLDFSKHYAGLFRQVGDTATAAVLEKIHLDEIGHVGHGLKLGRELGMATANIHLRRPPALAHGVYAVLARWPEQPDGLPGVASLGVRPTLGLTTCLLETHVFDAKPDLYGQEVAVEFHKFLRPQLKFDGLDTLAAQMQADGLAARHHFSQDLIAS